MKKETIILNIIGGPGVGKTTVASRLFAQLKKENFDVENVSEFAKELVWEGRNEAFKDRLYMHGEQNHRLMMMNGKLDYIVTDSPLILTSVYNDFHLKDSQSKSYNEMIHLVVKETWNLYNNKVYYIKRNSDYLTVGRRESEEQALKIDEAVLKYLKDNNIEYKVLNVDEAEEEILKDLNIKKEK